MLPSKSGMLVGSRQQSLLPVIFVSKKVTMAKADPDSGSSAIYGLGFIGAAVYYIAHASGFWAGVIGILKAFVWPAFLVYEALAAIGA